MNLATLECANYPNQAKIDFRFAARPETEEKIEAARRLLGEMIKTSKDADWAPKIESEFPSA